MSQKSVFPDSAPEPWGDNPPRSEAQGWVYDRRNLVLNISAQLATSLSLEFVKREDWQQQEDAERHVCLLRIADDAHRIATRLLENADKAFPRPN